MRLRYYDGLHVVVGGVGIEPTTIRLKVECSTTELPAHPNPDVNRENRAFSETTLQTTRITSSGAFQRRHP
jgi:hypothetical protein